MPTTCEISFENPNRAYYAGQWLRGSVILTLTDVEKVRGIYIRIYGRAYAYWTEYCTIDHNSNRNRNRNRSRSSSHYVPYTGEEVYLDEKTYFVGDNNSNEIQLSPGTHTYTFQCLLPVGLPTSVEHSVGHITYSANVVMWRDKEFKEHFTVIKPIDLNCELACRNPSMNKIDQTFYPLGFLCCYPNGPLSIGAFTPVSGYTPGQTINVKVNVNNESKQILSNMEVQLNKQITFSGHGTHAGRYESRQKHVDQIITKETVCGYGPGEGDTKYVYLEVPPIPPTDFSTSNVVQVKYIIRVTGSIESCCHGVTPIDIPIVIGSIPLRDNFEASAISGQPKASHKQISEETSMIAPTPMPIPMPPNQTGTLLTELLPSAPFTIDPTSPIESDVPRALSSAAYAPNIPSAPDFGENPPSYEEAMNLGDGNSNN